MNMTLPTLYEAPWRTTDHCRNTSVTRPSVRPRSPEGLLSRSVTGYTLPVSGTTCGYTITGSPFTNVTKSARSSQVSAHMSFETSDGNSCTLSVTGTETWYRTSSESPTSPSTTVVYCNFGHHRPIHTYLDPVSESPGL